MTHKKLNILAAIIVMPIVLLLLGANATRTTYVGTFVGDGSSISNVGASVGGATAPFIISYSGNSHSLRLSNTVDNAYTYLQAKVDTNLLVGAVVGGVTVSAKITAYSFEATGPTGNAIVGDAAGVTNSITAGKGTTNIVIAADGRTVSVADPPTFTGLTLVSGPAQITFGTPTNKVYSGSGSNDLKFASSTLNAELDLSNAVFKVNVPVVLSNSVTLSGQIASGGVTNAAGSRVAYMTDIATQANGSTLTNIIVDGDSTIATNVWYFTGKLTTGTNVSLLLTNQNGATLYYTPANGLTVSNSAANGTVANYLYSDNRQTNFFVESQYGIMETNSQGFVWAVNDGFMGSNRLTGNFVSSTNGALKATGLVSADTLNGTNGVNIGALVGITSSDGYQMQYGYVTNGIYFSTNTFSFAPYDMRFASQRLITATNVTLNSFANLTNGVENYSRCWASNSSASTITFTFASGLQVYGDFSSATYGTFACTNGKSAMIEFFIVPGLMSNATFKVQKN